MRAVASQAPARGHSADLAADRLRDEILSGKYPSGHRLREKDLAGELELSRTPIRQALLTLEAEGLVELHPNRGATVRGYALEDLDEMYSLRALLEGHAAARAASRITKRQLQQLEESQERIARFDPATQLDESVAENLNFHGIIFEAAASPRLTALLETVTRVPTVYRSYYWYTEELRAISEQLHGWIIGALRDRDPERARRLATEHVLHARDVLIEHFSKDEGAHRD
jgi:DNA-binding GntR family transcriptional regulator